MAKVPDFQEADYSNFDEDASANEVYSTLECSDFFSFLFYWLLGGWLFSHWFSKTNNCEVKSIHSNSQNLVEPTEGSIKLFSSETKNFLKQVWLFEEEIPKARKSEEWVRLCCLYLSVRHLTENQWRSFIDGQKAPNQAIIDSNLRNLLQLILKMNPESTCTNNLSPRVMRELQNGGLQMDENDLSFTFKGKQLLEEPWPEEYFN